MLALIVTLVGTLVMTSVAADEQDIFGPFPDASGTLQSATGDPSLNGSNPFFNDRLGTNGQACVTCHQPDQGFTINVPFIQERFEASGGLDPLFRTNDTADRPDADVSTAEARRDAFKLFSELGIIRIGKTLPANPDFMVASQESLQFGVLPNLNDPQAPSGSSTLSLFRRPLVNTNVHFDSAVLWDGRADIHDMRAQVKNAARGLLLSQNVSDADADAVAAFMLGVFSDQIFDNNAGNLVARGATAGVFNLQELAVDPAAPCTPLAPPATCTPIFANPETISLFDPWASVPSKLPNNARNTDRATVARGQMLFNSLVCVGCHATTNIGNNPDPTFFIRLGLDSRDINDPISLAVLAAQDPRVNSLLDRVKMLPEYCLRPASDTSNTPCGSDPGDVRTTDPGRAMVTGFIFDVGEFKPPILRDLSTRAPFFHNGAAATLDDLVNFYNARFGLGLSDQQHNDLVAFLHTL